MSPLYIPYSPQGSTQIKSVYAARSLVAVYIFLQVSRSLPAIEWKASWSGSAAAGGTTAIAPTNLSNRHRNFSLKTGVKKTIERKL